MLRQDRTGIHLERGQVHRAPRLGDARGERVAHAVPAGEGGEKGGVRVQDAVGKRRVHGLGQHGTEAGHGHQVHLVGHQRCRHRRRISGAIECGPEAAVPGAVDELGRGAMGPGQLEGGAGPVRHDDGHRKPGLEHGIEDRPTSRYQDSHAHAGHASNGAAEVVPAVSSGR